MTFALNAPVDGGGERTLPPQGNHVGRCVQVIDLGTHYEERWQKWKRKIRVTFELPNEQHVFDEKKGPEPFFVGKEYGLFLSSKATLRKDLDSWRSVAMTDEQAAAFDVFSVISVPAMINVTHSENGRYANIAAITPLPKGLECPAQINPSIVYSPYMPAEESASFWPHLPEWIQKRLQESREFKEAQQPPAQPVNAAANARVSPNTTVAAPQPPQAEQAHKVQPFTGQPDPQQVRYTGADIPVEMDVNGEPFFGEYPPF